MPEDRLVVVTGAAGFVGSKLVRQFAAAGMTVRALVHENELPRQATVESRRWALGSPAGHLLDGASVLVHAALVPYDGSGASAVNVQGSLALIEEARRAGVRQIVFLSSMSARRDASSRYGRDKWRIAQHLDRPGELVVRPGLVLGTGGLFGRLRGFVASSPVVPLIGGGRQQVQTVLVDDLAVAIVRAVERDLDGQLRIAAPEPVRFRTLLEELARVLGRRVLFVPVPSAPVAVALRAVEALGLRLPVNSENLAGLHGMRAELVARDLDRIGVQIRDHRASLRALESAVNP